MFKYVWPLVRPAMNAACAAATVPPWAVMKAGLYVEAVVRSNDIK
jgi:hypothetical protein